MSNALTGRETLACQLLTTQNQLADMTTRRRLINLHLANKAASQLKLLGAQRPLFGVQQALVQTRLALLARFLLSEMYERSPANCCGRPGSGC